MSLKRFFLALLFGVVLVQAGLQCAKAEPPYRVVLEDEFGNQLPTYAHQSEWFAMGRDGQRYNVRVYNHTNRRVEAVVSVDGRDVLSGQPGDFKNQRGYLVPAYSSVLIEGFRTSLSNVAAFRFTSPDDSYSARMGTPENVGVIGAAFFPEAEPPRPPVRPVIPYDYNRVQPAPSGSYREPARPAPRRDAHTGALGSGTAGRSEGKSKPSKESAAPRASSSYGAAEAERDSTASNIGTQYGEDTYSQVDEVQFKRARPRSPDRIVTLRYDDRDGLIARGILPRPQPRRYDGPEPFPVNRFAPPPPPRPYWY